MSPVGLQAEGSSKLTKENSLKHWYNSIQGVIIMNSERELFNLAKNYVMLVDLYERARVNNEEFKEHMEEIRSEVLEKGYDIDKFVEYQDLYRKLSIKEYYNFIKTLD